MFFESLLMSSIRSVILTLFCALTLAACSTAPPEGLHPVTSFDLNRYLGQWYEIARLDHSFERGMSDVNATYQLQDDGSVKVINRGYDTQRQAWKEAIGRALFIGDPGTASLKVSFFGRIVIICGFSPATGLCRPRSASNWSVRRGRLALLPTS